MTWMIFSPELYYLLVSLWFLVLSMLPGVNSKRDYFSAVLLAAGGVLVCLLAVRSEGLLFSNAYQIDLFSQVFKVLLALGLFLIVCLCPNVGAIREKHHPDFYLLLFVCTLAMLMLVSSVHLLAMYVSLELSSYALYILVALRRDKDLGIEAGIKYFMIGITASAVMLFGLALLYATTQVAHADDMFRVLPAVIDQPVVILGLLLTLSERRNRLDASVEENKLDRENALVDGVVAALQKSFGREVVPVQLPIGQEHDFEGVVDLVTQKALYFDGPNGETVREEPIPDDMKEEARRWKQNLLEKISEVDEKLLEKFMEDKPVGDRELSLAIRKAQTAELSSRRRNLVTVSEQVYAQLEEGMVSQLEVFEVERTLLDAEQEMLANHWLVLTDTIALFKALGGGWPREVVAGLSR